MSTEKEGRLIPMELARMGKTARKQHSGRDFGKAKDMREALQNLIDAFDMDVPPEVGARLVSAAMDEARRHVQNKRYLVKVKGGGYAKTEGGGWACGVERDKATSYTEKVAYAYAHELGGTVEPAFRE